MLMVLEGKGSAYIQDRGVSRWDTCGAQACIEAYGGVMAKLSTFASSPELKSYTYLKGETNLDFVAGESNMTPYNVNVSRHVSQARTTCNTLYAIRNMIDTLCLIILLANNLINFLFLIFLIF